VWKYALFALIVQILIYFYRLKYIENVILETWNITLPHLVISSVLAFFYIIFTWMYFNKVHEATAEAYEEMFNRKNKEIYEWGDVFYLIALASGGANIICPIWRPYFVAIMIVSIFASMYHFTKIYTKFEKNS
jgi:flagellar biosynthesis protein FlhB